jgi:hypothetical protein
LLETLERKAVLRNDYDGRIIYTNHLLAMVTRRKSSERGCILSMARMRCSLSFALNKTGDTVGAMEQSVAAEALFNQVHANKPNVDVAEVLLERSMIECRLSSLKEAVERLNDGEAMLKKCNFVNEEQGEALWNRVQQLRLEVGRRYNCPQPGDVKDEEALLSKFQKMSDHGTDVSMSQLNYAYSLCQNNEPMKAITYANEVSPLTKCSLDRPVYRL